MFKLGQFLRRRYDSIVDDNRPLDEIVHIRSE